MFRFGLINSFAAAGLLLLFALQCDAQKKNADLSQQVVQKVGKIDLGNYRLDTFINNADVSSARKVNRTKTDRLREMEWERDVVTTLNQTQSRRTRDKPLGFRNILTNRLVGEQRCDYCVPSRHLQHYHSWNCTPSFSRECNCAKYYRCSLVKNEVAKVQSNDYCEHNGRRYNIGDMIHIEEQRCSICRCGRSERRNKFGVQQTGAEIDCSVQIECPEMVFGVKPSSDQCYFAYDHQRCCGTEICPDQMNVTDIRRNMRCQFESKVYRYGEKIYSEQNPCLECICNEQWNNHDPESSGSCQPIYCKGLRKMETRGCTPVYSKDGCCPIDYLCNKRIEHRLALINTHTCLFDDRQYRLGEKVSFSKDYTLHHNVCANCTCLVPPLLTCHLNSRCEVGYSSLSL